MSHAPDLLQALLDSWDRNNTILVNLLSAIPKDALGTRATEEQLPVWANFLGISITCGLCLFLKTPPELAGNLPGKEWAAEPDPARMALLLNDSAKAVQDAVKSRVEAGRAMDIHYDHPILLLQHMIWHEGYHHGQIKLVLKLSGRPISNEEAGPLTWRIWMNKTKGK